MISRKKRASNEKYGDFPAVLFCWKKIRKKVKKVLDKVTYMCYYIKAPGSDRGKKLNKKLFSKKVKKFLTSDRICDIINSVVNKRKEMGA